MADIFNLSFKKNGKPGRVSALRIKKAILKAHTAKKADPLKPSLLTLSDAYITGDLNLSGLFLDPEEVLIGLSFKNCTFPEPISFNHIKIKELSFDSCTLVTLSAIRSHVDGSVKLHRVTSAETKDKATGATDLDNWHKGRGPQIKKAGRKSVEKKRPQGLCVVDFSGSHITGNFHMTESLLVNKPINENIDKTNSSIQYALNLAAITISSILIQNRCALLGGLNIADSQINSILLMTGSLTKQTTEKAIHAQRVCVDGFVGLRPELMDGKEVVRSEFYGTCDFGSAHLKAVDIPGAYFHAYGQHVWTLTLGSARIGSFLSGQCFFDELPKNDPQNQYITEFSGDFIANNSVFENSFSFHANHHMLHQDSAYQQDNNYRPIINLCNSEFKSNVLFFGHWESTLWLYNNTIEGSVQLGDHWHELKITAPSNTTHVMDMQNTRIGGSINPMNFKVESTHNLRELHSALKSKEEIYFRRSPLPYTSDIALYEYAVMINNKRHYGVALDIDGALHHMHGHGEFLSGPMRRAGVTLKSDEDQISYIRTFSSIVMGNYGPYRIIEPGDWFTQHLSAYQQSLITPIKKLASDEPNIARFNVSVWYGYELFTAVFVLDLTQLSVIMEEGSDKALDQNAPVLTSHSAPLIMSYERIPAFDEIWHRPSYVPEATPETTVMSPHDRRQLKSILPKPRGYDAERPVINMRNMHVGQLQDDDGSAWPVNAHYLLGGLTYDTLETTTKPDKILNLRQYFRNFRHVWMVNRAMTGDGQLQVAKRIYKNDLAYWITEYSGEDLGKIGKLKLLWLGLKWAWFSLRGYVGSENPFEKRKKWLQLQYISRKPTRLEFNPQPFEQIATTFRKQGQMNEYRRMLRLRSRWENACMTSRLWRPFSYIYGCCFGYGYSIKRALATLFMAVLIGYFGVQLALQKDVMVASSAYGGPTEYIAQTAPPNDVTCRQVITPSLYALDLFLPVVELGQEKRCHLKPDEGRTASDMPRLTRFASDDGHSLRNWFDEVTTLPRVWLVMVTLYKLSGWIILSLMILTFTKIFRLNVEE